MSSSALLEEQTDEPSPRPFNLMKFSFNKTSTFPADYPSSQHHTIESSRLKDIYYKAFEK
jgi:hypothetical protein